MSLLAMTYLAYLAAAVYVTIVVGNRLHHHGRPFLIECFAGRTELADAVNHLLLVGYYVLNFALAALLLRTGPRPLSVLAACELLGTKLGTVMLILGIMHFINVTVALWVRSQWLSLDAVLANSSTVRLADRFHVWRAKQ